MGELALLFLASAAASFVGCAIERALADWRRRRRRPAAFKPITREDLEDAPWPSVFW